MHYRQLAEVEKELTGAGGPFEITQVSVRGESIRHYRHAPPDLRTFWLSTAAFAERDYLIYGTERISYAEAHAQVQAIAGWLADVGVRPGDRVAIAMRNYPEWLLIYWACVASGIAAVGMNAWWTAEEMAHALADAEPAAIFLDEERLARLCELPDEGRSMQRILVRSEARPPEGVHDWNEVIAHPGGLPDDPIDPDADACIFYTSGTTGHPKGAQLTHRSCLANMFSMLYAGASAAMATARAAGTEPEPPQPPVFLITTPLFHVTANNCAVYATTVTGGALVFMYRWDAGEALRIIERDKVTGMSGVPVMVRELLDHPDFATTDLSSLAGLAGGGSQLSPDLVHKVEERCSVTRPSTGYGMTETSGIVTSINGDFFVDKPESVGPAMPNFEVRCVDDDGADVPVGEVGELLVRGSSVIKGYLNQPEATAATISNGWLRTGDIARLDEHGFIYIVDRKKDMVIRGGENVYCAEVESALYRHDDVAECCVFGVPDERLGEEVAVAVVLKPGSQASAEDLRQHCANILARYKVPAHVWLLDEALPRNASGKFLRRELKERFLQSLKG